MGCERVCNRQVAPAAGEKPLDHRVGGFGQYCFRIPCGDHSFADGVEEDGVVADGEDARQFVGHDDDGGAQAVAQFEDEVVEQPRADRVEPGRGLVEEQDLGIERHRPGEPGAFLHPAADLGRVIVLEAGEADQRQLECGHLADAGGWQISELLQRQGHVLRQGH